MPDSESASAVMIAAELPLTCACIADDESIASPITVAIAMTSVTSTSAMPRRWWVDVVAVRIIKSVRSRLIGRRRRPAQRDAPVTRFVPALPRAFEKQAKFDHRVLRRAVLPLHA